MAIRPSPAPVRPLQADRSVSRLLEAFDRVPVAATIRRAEDLPRALASQVPAIFFLRAPAFHLGPLVWAVQARGKMAFVHIDLIAGLGKDRAGVAFLAREIGVNGIVSSHGHLIAAARADRVIAVQRLLLHDDLGLPSALTALERAQPDIVEVLPGVIFPEIVHLFGNRVAASMIVGGLITDPSQQASILQAGARAITTSAVALWP